MAKTWKSKVWASFLLIFCGIPGVLAFVFSSIVLVGRMFDPRMRADLGLRPTILLVVISIVGLALSLIGVGKWRQWRYALVFIAIPFSFLVFALLGYYAHFMPGLGVLGFGICLGAAAWLALKFVRRSENSADRGATDSLKQ